MINLYVNGQSTQSKETRLDKFLEKENKNDSNFAVAINEYFIPKSAYQTIEMKDGDQIEIVVPMQGG